jgi:hypothetical protein
VGWGGRVDRSDPSDSGAVVGGAGHWMVNNNDASGRWYNRDGDCRFYSFEVRGVRISTFPLYFVFCCDVQSVANHVSWNCEI